MTLLLPILAQSSGWQGVADGNGLAISITGMLIVFVALTAITLFIAALPKVLAVIEPWFPESAGHHHGAAPSAPATAPASAADDGAVIAAIGFAVHSRSQGGKS